MNKCEQYREQYQRMKELHQRFSNKLRKVEETGIKDPEINEIIEEIKEIQTEITPLLEKHFLKIELLEDIEGFDNNIRSFHSISETEVFVGGAYGELRVFNTENKTFSERIEGFDNHMYSFHPISETEVLVGGNNGELKIFKKKLDLDKV